MVWDASPSHKQGGNDPQDEHRQDRDATYHREES